MDTFHSMYLCAWPWYVGICPHVTHTLTYFNCHSFPVLPWMLSRFSFTCFLYMCIYFYLYPPFCTMYMLCMLLFFLCTIKVIIIFFFSIHSHCLNHFPKQIYVIITNLLMALNPSNHQLQVSFMYWMLTLSNAVIVGREMTSSRSKININKAGSSLLFNNTCDRRHQLDNIIFHRTMLFLSSFCEARRE